MGFIHERGVFEMKKSMKLMLSTAVLLALVNGGVQAADTSETSLDEIVVTADKDKAYAGRYLTENTSMGMLRNKDMMELPAATMTITDKAIKDFAISGNNEIMDILSLNPSIRRTTSPNVVSVRGKYTTAAQMSVNNIPGMYSNFTMGTNFIGNIDILGGPSLVYSGSTTQNISGGTVNYRSKVAEKEPVTTANVKYTSTGNLQESVDVSRRFGNDQSWGIRINALTGDGNLATHGEKLKNRNIFVNLDHQAVDSSTNLLMGYARSKHYGGNSIFQTVSSSAKDYLGIMPFLPSAPDGKHNLNPSWAYTDSKTWLMTLNHDQKINDHWTAFLNTGIMKNDTPVNISGSSMISILQFGKDGSFDGSFKRALTMGASGSTARYIGAGFKSDYDFGFMKNEFVFAVDRNSVVNRTQNSTKTLGTYFGNLYQNNDWDAPANLNPVGTRLGSKYITKGYSIMDTMKFLDDKLIINAGLHHHSYQSRSYNASGKASSENDYDGNCPSFGVVYRFTPNFSAYAQHTETFLGGTVVGSSYNNHGSLLPPAKTKNNEFGLKLKNGKLTHTLAVYETKQPETVTDADNNLFYGGETKFKGIEWSTAGTINDKLDFIASIGFNRYIWTRNINSSLNGLTADGIPKWTGNLALAYHATDAVTVLGRFSYIGDSHIGHGTYTVPAYYRYDLGVKYDTILGHTPVTFSAMCYNLTNKKGWYTADQGNQLLAADPRTFVVSAEMRF